MPNHISNILTIEAKGKQLEKILEKIKGTDEEGNTRLIDFENIIPKPKSLNISASSSVDYALGVLLAERDGDFSHIDGVLSYPWVKENFNETDSLKVKREKTVAFFRKKAETEDGFTVDFKEGEIAYQNLKEYGYTDWYNWNCDNWGTKWNAYSIEKRDKNVIYFETAWATPTPIFIALSEMFPKATFKVRFADEDFGYNVGEIHFRNGNMVLHIIPEGGSEEAYGMACDIKGYGGILGYFSVRDLHFELEADKDNEWANKMLNIAVQRKEDFSGASKLILNKAIEFAVELEEYEFAEVLKNIKPTVIKK